MSELLSDRAERPPSYELDDNNDDRPTWGELHCLDCGQYDCICEEKSHDRS